MREIKFRAWDEEDKRMYCDDKVIVTFIGFLEEVYVKRNSTVDELIDYKLMQYTGIKDSNGNEIYEGDIVKVEDYFGGDIIGNIIYDEITAGYVFNKGNEINYFQITLDLEDYVHYVIGNIYENPELLEGRF